MDILCMDLTGFQVEANVAHRAHLGMEFPDASSFCKATIGQAKVWTCFRLDPTWMELKSSSLDVLSFSTSRLLWRSAAFQRSYILKENVQ